MTDLSRRAFFGATFGLITQTPTAFAQRPTELRRVSQREYNLAIAQHADWLRSERHGLRAVFCYSDLSGLVLSREGEDTDLTGADFTGCSLKDCVADGLKFVSASIQDCDLSGSRFKRPVFARSTLRRANCSKIVWGVKDARLGLHATEKDGASLMDCYAGFANFNHARIAGFFFNTTFHDSEFRYANLSNSDIVGNDVGTYVSFAGCDLTSADFSHCRISGASFSNATLSGTNFSDCDVDTLVSRLDRVGRWKQ